MEGGDIWAPDASSKEVLLFVLFLLLLRLPCFLADAHQVSLCFHLKSSFLSTIYSYKKLPMMIPF